MTKRKHSNRKTKDSPPNRRQNHSHKGFDESLLFGFHAVKEALANPKRKLVELKATKNALRALGAALENALARHHKSLKVTETTPENLSKLFKANTVHQGVALHAHPLAEIELETLIAGGKTLIVLDQVTDPRNIGAIMRAATVFGAGGIIVTRHHAPTAGGALAKTASGAVEHMPLVAVANLARCLTQLNDAGYVTLGLDERATILMADIDRTLPIALVMGAEGKGLRRLTRENCTQLVRLPNAVTLISDGVASDGAKGAAKGGAAKGGAASDATEDPEFACLNVATATAVSLYELIR